jgi:HEAT repeat protein
MTELWFKMGHDSSERYAKMNYTELLPDQLVDLLADKTQRNAAIVALVGGITATELRKVKVGEAAKQALIAGLKHPNSKVRWWCIRLMDHIADENYILPLLDAAQTDPTPKNRRHAIHALTCEVCKPDRQKLKIDDAVRAELGAIARSDIDLSVRQTALHELAELNKSAEISL